MKSKGIGLRNVKTAIAVLIAILIKVILVLAIDLPTGEAWSKIIYTPFFGGIAAAYSMHANKKASLKQAKIRTMGSIVGGLYGMIILIICEAALIYGFKMQRETATQQALYYLIDFAIVAFAMIPMIHITVMTKTTYATWIACLTYLSVTISIRNDFDDQLAGKFSSNAQLNAYIIAVVFSLNRILSTIIGVSISLGVNLFHLPHKTKNKDLLFVVGIEGMLNDDYDTIKGFMNYKLNKVTDAGINTTLFTTRIPSTFMYLLDTVQISHPVVCMSGAALYDTKSNKYLYTDCISYELSNEVDTVLSKLDVTPFKNYIIDDVLYTYISSIDNDGERAFYEEKKNAQYSNMILGECNQKKEVTHYLICDKLEKCDEIVEKLKEAGLADQLEIQIYNAFIRGKTFEGLKFLKIYSKSIKDLNVLKKYCQEYGYRTVGLTTSTMADNLLENSDLRYSCSDTKVEGTVKLSTYDSLFKMINKVYYSKNEKK